MAKFAGRRAPLSGSSATAPTLLQQSLQAVSFTHTVITGSHTVHSCSAFLLFQRTSALSSAPQLAPFQAQPSVLSLPPITAFSSTVAFSGTLSSHSRAFSGSALSGSNRSVLWGSLTRVFSTIMMVLLLGRIFFSSRSSFPPLLSLLDEGLQHGEVFDVERATEGLRAPSSQTRRLCRRQTSTESSSQHEATVTQSTEWFLAEPEDAGDEDDELVHHMNQYEVSSRSPGSPQASG